MRTQEKFIQRNRACKMKHRTIFVRFRFSTLRVQTGTGPQHAVCSTPRLDSRSSWVSWHAHGKFIRYASHHLYVIERRIQMRKCAVRESRRVCRNSASSCLSASFSSRSRLLICICGVDCRLADADKEALVMRTKR